MRKLLLEWMATCWLLSALFSGHAFGAEEIGRQEDSTPVSGQVLVPVGCQREDTLTVQTAATNRYGLCKMSDLGRIHVEALLATGSSVIGKLAGNSGVIIGDVNLVSSIPAGNNNIGDVDVLSIIPGTAATNLGKAEGGTHTNADTGVFAMGVRRDTSTTGLDANGTYTAFGMNNLGELYTQANTELPAAAQITADAQPSPTAPSVYAFLMCWNGTSNDRCRPGVTDLDDGLVASGQTTSMLIGLGHVYSAAGWVRNQADPCSYLPKTVLPINVSSATTTEVTSSLAGSLTNYYVCSVNLITAAANNVAFVDDDNDNCPSLNNGMNGGTTAASGWNFSANGGIVLGGGNATVLKTNGTNRVICLVTSAATQLSGNITVVQAP